MIVVSAEQMRRLDQLTIQRYGVSSLHLMERAGAAVARALLERFRDAASKGVLVVAGKGNNGGDGFVVARLLAERGLPCTAVLLARRDEVSADAAHNLKAYLAQKGEVTEADGEVLAALGRKLDRAGVVVDAILGTGVKSEVRGLYAEAITMVNASGRPVVAVDIPSGLDTDTGAPLGTVIQADMTVALGYPKIGQVVYPGIGYCGELAVADIGLDPRAVEEVAPDTELVEREQVRRLVPRRRADSHKGTYGHLLIFAGSRGKTGAAILCSRAAMRVGAGLVTLAAPLSLNDILAGSLVEVMTAPLEENDAKEVQPLGAAEWSGLLDRKDALLFGPGIGVNDWTQSTLRWLLRHLEIPWVIDADGLNNLALQLDRLKSAKTPPVLTPHPGEMARLLGTETAAVNRDRVGSARAFAAEHRCHVVLKGARTVIATRDGKVFINPTGNPGLASGGTGDVLAGMIAAFLGQRLAPADAMVLAVYLHGDVGDQVAARSGQIGLIASDIIEGLPGGLKRLGTEGAI